MAIDLNTLGEEEDQFFDLNKPPAEDHDEVDGGRSVEGHHLGLNPEGTQEQQELHQGQTDEVDGADNDRGQHWGLDLDEIDEQQEVHEWEDISHDAGLPFDLNDPQEEEENLRGGDDNIGLKDAQDAMDHLIREIGVYIEAVNIIFDEKDLTDSDDEEFQETHQDQASNATKNLIGRQRQDIYEELLQRSKNGNLKRIDTTHVATKFNVQLRTVQRIWQRAKKCKAQGIPIDVKSLKPKNCGRKKNQVDLSRVADIPLNRRGTIRSLANAHGVKKITLRRWFKEGLLKPHSSAIRPYLKVANKKDRLSWCVSMLDPSTLPNDPKFLDMKNIIHTDEKWFNGSKKDKMVYMHPDKEDPHRTVLPPSRKKCRRSARPKSHKECRCSYDIGYDMSLRPNKAEKRTFAVTIKNDPALSSHPLPIRPCPSSLCSTSFSPHPASPIPSTSSSSLRAASPLHCALSSSSFSPRAVSSLRSTSSSSPHVAAHRSGSGRPTGVRADTTSARLLRHATSARILRGAWSLASSFVAWELPQTAAASPSPSRRSGLPSPPSVGGGVLFPIWTRRRQPTPFTSARPWPQPLL